VPERLLVIIPAYNEAGRVGAVVRDVRSTLPHTHVLVVDDASDDATADEAAEAGAAVISLPVNSGYGAALQTGFKYAVRHRFNAIAQLDGDGQHRAEHLPRMLNCLAEGDADVVIGSRFLDPKGNYSPSIARKLGIGLFARMVRVFTHQHVTDPTSGFQVMSQRVADFFCSNVYPADYPDADILILLHRSGFRLKEIPVVMHPSPRQSMHSGHRSLYYVYKMMLSILVTLLRPRTRVPL
jgi:glycosyltransferase involved in cell wall biosynthesis